ncbi:MAG: outer membrane lipoprotein carrier protein LolA [Muribaculaceae bacterium]|nr:outer membrane lipoprotein carrier protein LolA [Muribaculaceae bacterium]
MKKVYLAILSLIIVALPGFSQNKLTADQVLAKSVALLTNAKGISADFSISGGGTSGKGTIKSSGTKFNVVMPTFEVWFNGKNMYTYNKRSSETTLVAPTASEIAESNPLMYVKGAQGSYTASFSAEKKTGKYIIDLVPKKKTNEMKKLTLTIRASDYSPEKIVAVPKSGSQIVISISQLKTNQNFTASVFEYPKSKYPKVEVIDLR